MNSEKEETATLAGGCFWCSEAVFKMLKGVKKVTSGYSGGAGSNPSYEDVSTGSTNHAESIQIIFDPKIISFKDILYVFLKMHDPTTLNQQGADIGTQYRSVIFYHNEKQQRQAQEALEKAKQIYSKPIVTQILAFKSFYEAEEYHQDFYQKNPNQAYCKLVIDPKIQKLKKEFKEYLK